MKLIESAKKITALAVAFTFALSPVPNSFAQDSNQTQVEVVNGQSVPVADALNSTPNPDLAQHMASSEIASPSKY